METTMKEQVGEYAVRGGPGLTVGGLAVGGMPLSDVVLILTGIYTALQIGWFIYSKYKMWKNGRERK